MSAYNYGVVSFVLLLWALPITPLSAVASAPISVAPDYTIRLKNRDFLPDQTTDLTNRPAPISAAQAPRHYVLAQFTQVPSVAELNQLDLHAMHFVSAQTLLLSIPVEFGVNSLPNLRWTGNLEPSDRISTRASLQLDQASLDAPLTLLVEGFPDAGSEFEAMLWNHGGTIEPHPSLPPHVKLVSAPKAVFSVFAKQNQVAWISQPDVVLLAKVPIIYCPGAVTPYGSVANFSAPSVGWDGQGLGAASLQYYFGNDTDDIVGTAEHNAVERAFNEWARYAQLTFTRTYTAHQTRSIDILWATHGHGDGEPFDRAGGVIAHAFFPTPDNRETIAGDLHFDDSEQWSLPGFTAAKRKRRQGNVDIFTVALHEIGHTLGLSHSDAPGAVMRAFYAGPMAGLTADDISGIRAIYSSRAGDPVIVPDPGAANIPSTGAAVPGCTPVAQTDSTDPGLLIMALSGIGLLWRRQRK